MATAILHSIDKSFVATYWPSVTFVLASPQHSPPHQPLSLVSYAVRIHSHLGCIPQHTFRHVHLFSRQKKNIVSLYGTCTASCSDVCCDVPYHSTQKSLAPFVSIFFEKLSTQQCNTPNTCSSSFVWSITSLSDTSHLSNAR